MSNVTKHPASDGRHPLCDSDDLAFELALGYFGIEDICLKFGIQPEDLSAIQKDPGFQALVLDALRIVDERGDAFRLQARKHMDGMLDTLTALANDEKTGRAVRLQAISMLAKYAGYEEGEKAASGVTLQIKTNLDVGKAKAGAGGSYVIEASPVTDDGEDLL